MAHDFLCFAQANPKPCPVLAVSEAGDTRLPTLGGDLDIRTDIPRYRVWRHGELVEEPTDIRHLWREDLVSFPLGCSGLDGAARQAEIRNLNRSATTVIGTLDGSHDAHNCRVVDVEAPGNARQTFPVDVSSPDDLADLMRGQFGLPT